MTLTPLNAPKRPVLGRSQAILAAILLLTLVGCAGGPTLFGDKLFGGPQAQTEQPQAGLVQDAAATQAAPPVPAVVSPDYFLVHGKCPEVLVEGELQALTVYAKGTTEGDANVRYQATIEDTARECNGNQPGQLTLRVGVAGRVVGGPKGTAGTVNIPVRISVVDAANKVVKTGWETVAVTLASPDFSGDYREVQEISVPAPDADETYTIQAALDPNPPKPPPPKAGSRPVASAGKAGTAPPAKSNAFRWPG